MIIASYYTDIDDAQWNKIRRLLPLANKRACRRRILDALVYICVVGCSWRLLPKDFDPWKTVYHVFRHWATTATLRQCRLRRGQEDQSAQAPSAARHHGAGAGGHGHAGRPYRAGRRRGRVYPPGIPVFWGLKRLWVDGGYAGEDFAKNLTEHSP